jgi:hypothetical protein
MMELVVILWVCLNIQIKLVLRDLREKQELCRQLDNAARAIVREQQKVSVLKLHVEKLIDEEIHVEIEEWGNGGFTTRVESETARTARLKLRSVN